MLTRDPVVTLWPKANCNTCCPDSSVHRCHHKADCTQPVATFDIEYGLFTSSAMHSSDTTLYVASWTSKEECLCYALTTTKTCQYKLLDAKPALLLSGRAYRPPSCCEHRGSCKFPRAVTQRTLEKRKICPFQQS